jgi:hypothetical protein
LPGIVRDPGNAEPKTTVARGLNLDGTDDGHATARTCAHPKYVSQIDGTTKVDNQLYTAEGCIQSYQGHKGFIMQFANNQMHDGLLTMLAQVTGLDNARNDDHVEVTLFYSLDPMVKNATGTQVAPHYTFRVTDNAQYTHFFTRLRARMINGVIVTDPVKELRMNLGIYGSPPDLKILDARLRLEMAPDGTMKGVLAGYQDWKAVASRPVSSAAEQVHNFQVPGFYNALKRAADGMKDPATGRCNGISAAYDVEGIPAFIAPSPAKIAKAKDRRQVAEAQTQAAKAP